MARTTTKSPVRQSDRGGVGSPSPREHPMRWLSEQAKSSLRELPGQAAEKLSKALEPAESAAQTAAADTKDRARRMKASVLDASPVGDSVDERLRRAREAKERAEAAESEAVQAASEAKQRSEHARRVSEEAAARVAEVEKDSAARVKDRVAQARREADEMVERERAAARADAEEEVERAQADADEQSDAVRREAEAAHERARERMAEATDRVAEAKALATEAGEAARSAAEEAHQQAQALAEDADEQACKADEGVAAAERMRAEATGVARDAVRDLERLRDNGGLEARTKPELLDLAAALEVEGRTSMTKAELVKAIDRAPRKARR